MDFTFLSVNCGEFCRWTTLNCCRTYSLLILILKVEVFKDVCRYWRRKKSLSQENYRKTKMDVVNNITIESYLRARNDRNKWKSDGAISGEYGGWSSTSHANLLILPRVRFLLFDLALSCCRMTPFLLTIAGYFAIKAWFSQFNCSQ